MVVGVAIIITGAVSASLAIIFLVKRRRTTMKKAPMAASTAETGEGLDDNHQIDTDTPEKVSLSHGSSDHDDNISCNESTFLEFEEHDEKNSQGVNV